MSLLTLNLNLHISFSLLGIYLLFYILRVLEHIGNSRRNIEKEVKELLKLCRWEHCMPIEKLRRIRQKLRKLVQKYTVSGILLLPSNGYDKAQIKEANNNIEFLPSCFCFVLFSYCKVGRWW